MASEKDLKALAQKLDEWAQKQLEKPERDLLMCLLSRGAYIETPVNRKLVVGTTTHLGAENIREAVLDALAPLTKVSIPDPIEGWPRFSAWPRMDNWPRSGYWSLGLGQPPKELIHPVKPDVLPIGDPIDMDSPQKMSRKNPKPPK